MMPREKFESLVEEQFAKLPPHIVERLENVDFVLEDEATDAQLDEHGMRMDDELLGLYEGTAQDVRGEAYFAVLPDKITLFQGPIERCAEEDAVELRIIVYETLLHEIGHHFGFCEKDVRRLERKRARRKKRPQP